MGMKLSILNKLSTKFQLAFGLTSIVVSLLLFSAVLNLTPDNKQTIVDGRVSLSESVASATTLFLQVGDLNSIGSNLDFTIQRNPSLLAATLTRDGDKPLIFGDKNQLDPDSATLKSTTDRIILPILRKDEPWGKVVLYFTDINGNTLIEKVKSNNWTAVVFCALFSFIFFYLYLGKVLKALNPSKAIPGRVRSALDTLAEALLVIDQNSNVVLANKAFQEITGQSTDDLVGKKAESFDWQQNSVSPAPTDSSGALVFPWQQVIKSSEASRGIGLSLVGQTGDRHDFLVNCSPIMSGTRTSGVLVSLDDVTELEKKERELRVARDDAEEANRAKSDFLSNMSHEIRTPMTAILGFTEVLKRGGASSPHWEKHLGTISSSGKHLLELINDVLDLSKVESGALEVEALECEPHRVAHDVLQVLKVRANEKDITLELKIPAPIPQTIISDGSRMRQIITNLVGNAIKFTEQGGVEVILRYIDTDEHPQFAIDVVDSGIGMNEQQQAAVFKPFVQADSSITRRFGGTGLGLSISRKLSQALGGDITVSSEAGVGTTFTATIDVGAVDAVKLITEAQAFESLSQIDDTQHTNWTFPESRLLVIDDAAENRELLTIVLNDLGLNVDTAENGAIGVDMAKATYYDVILSDIQMPVMDGYETVKVMREIGQTQPIIALTANAMKGYEQRVIDAGFSHYMTKPIDIDGLTTLLAKLLNGTEQTIEEVSHPPVSTDLPASASAPTSEDTSPIVSRLANSGKLAAVVDKFIIRINEQLPLMQKAIDDGDMTELAALAHWLKGSGGTVGFDTLSAPAKELEELAKNNQRDQLNGKLDIIRGLARRLQSIDGTINNQHSAPTTAVVANQSPITVSPKADGDSADLLVIESRLATNPKFKSIVAKFLPRLKEKVSLMEDAKRTGDYVTLAELAHWLKGSGGMVGYDSFTQMAAKLEESAKAKDSVGVERHLSLIMRHSNQLNNQGNDGDQQNEDRRHAV